MKLEKITRDASGRSRWYDDACGTAHALELVGERWSLLIVRELMLGPRRFGDLRASLPGISANVLTQRLESLETAGVLARRKLPPPASVQVYELTPWGLEAEEAISALGRWAARSPDHDPTLPLSPVSLMLSFRTMFDAEKAGTASMTVGFRFGDEDFIVRIGDGVLTAARGNSDEAEVRAEGTPSAMAAIVYGGAGPDTVAITGDVAVFERFAGFFELPPKAS
ncbi:MAG TPA: winged helix-turn-helix transcriptional regulator [Brevundimonas sp.]|nr:winged helix-turn-helix transcriptional regulator [Brevundimonas sp.]